MINFTVGHILSSQQRFNICVCVVIAALVMCVSSKPTRDDNSPFYETNIAEKIDLRTFLTVYILPRLILAEVLDSSDEVGEDENDIEQQLQDKLDFDNLENNSYQDNSRIKRKSFAGLGNFDIMTATLDRQRQRRPIMMSINRLTMNGLQNLMRLQGRRRK